MKENVYSTPSQGKLPLRSAGTLLAALLLCCAISANAQLGSGWVQYSPTKKIHLDNDAGLQTYSWTSYKSVCSPICADYRSSSGIETFRILDSRSNRSEIRLQNEYSSGSRQFEGYVTITSPLHDESLFQIFGSTSGATQLMIRGFNTNNGTISGGGASISNIYGREVRINVIHLQENVGNRIHIYINGVRKASITDGEAVTNYMKYGCYGTTNGNVPAVVKWRNVRVFRDGRAPSTTSSLMAAPEDEEGALAISAAPNPAAIGGKVDLDYIVNKDSHVKISILNMNGQEVKTVVDEFKPAGQYTATWENGAASKGLYIVKMLQGRQVKTIKLAITE